MRSRAIHVVVVLACSQLLTACATGRIRHASQGVGPQPDARVEARVFPEVRLTKSSGEILTGKIVRLEAGRLRILPLPYWESEYVTVDVGELESVSVKRRKGGGLAMIASAMGASFMVSSLIGTAASRYDEDYCHWLYISGGAAAMAGIISTFPALRAEKWRKAFDMTGLTVQQKTAVVVSLMTSGK